MSSFYNMIRLDVSWDQLPLRIPPDLREHVAKHQKHSIRHLLNKREDSTYQPILPKTFNVDRSKMRYYRYIYKLVPNKMETKIINIVQNVAFWSSTQIRNPKKATRNGKQINPGIYSCGHQGSETFINFINPHYPGHDNVAGTCHFRVLPSSPQICQVNV